MGVEMAMVCGDVVYARAGEQWVCLSPCVESKLVIASAFVVPAAFLRVMRV